MRWDAPDCVPDAVLDLLSEYKEQGYEVWLELGLQTAHDKTLHRINRGHDFACYQHHPSGARARAESLFAPDCRSAGRRAGRMPANLERVVETGVDGIKLHPLHIVKGSTMAKAWEAGRLNGIELDDYTVTAGEMIRHTPPEVIYHRISASARRPTLLAPLWCENRWTGMVELDKYLNEHGVRLGAGYAMGAAGDLTLRRPDKVKPTSGNLRLLPDGASLIRPTINLLRSFPDNLRISCTFSNVTPELSIIVPSCREGTLYEANPYAGAILRRPDDEAGSGALFAAVGAGAGGAGDRGADGRDHGAARPGGKH
jgi:hypothetical protein